MLLSDSIILCNGNDFSFPFHHGLSSEVTQHVFNAEHSSMALLILIFVILSFPTMICNLVGCFQCAWSGVVKLLTTLE